MTARLFDDIKRTDTGPMQHNEAHYEYLNRSARPEAGKIRSLLEDWFSRYPKEEQENFCTRFRKIEDDSAFFELYIHETLLKQGFTCEVHPKVKGNSTRPEFLVYYGGQPRFYLEAKVVYPNYNKVFADFLSDLDAIQSNFYFDVFLEGKLKTKPPIKDFKNWLEQRREPEEVYRIKDKDTGAEITITITLAKWKSAGNVSVVGGLDETANAIRKAIHKKAAEYGELDLPFLLAINVINEVFLTHVGPEQIADAMFGQRVVIFHKGSQETTHTRDCKSAKFLNPKGSPQNTRVSGIIVVGCLNPWNFNGIIPELWHNPWAKYPFPSELWQLPQQVPSKSAGVYEKMEGKAISDLLGLPPNWPED